MSFLISLILIIVIQVAIEFLLLSLGFDYIIINLVIDLVLALVFTLFNFRGREKLKNPDFHKTLAMYFIVLTLMSFLFGAYW